MRRIRPVLMLLVAALAAAFAITAAPVAAATLEELQEEIQAKRQAREEIEARIREHKESIEAKQREAASLKNQISVLDDRISVKELEIDGYEAQIEEKELEIEQTLAEIGEREQDIDAQKQRIAAFIRTIDGMDRKGAMEILFLNRSLSEFFDQAAYLEEIEGDMHLILMQIKGIKAELEGTRDALEEEREELAELKSSLVYEQQQLQGTKTYKHTLLEEAEDDEEKYQELVKQAKQEQQAADADIVNLERQIRRAAQSDEVELAPVGTLDWPLAGPITITAYFHDPDYPYKHIFSHPAIDLRAAQGTPVLAAGDGYVARARDAGYGYSYVMLVHGDGFSTVYGHISNIHVSEDQYVSRGQIIGLSGGMPGTPGAGRLTTGPHLHFEVRKNGIPVNPLNHLP